MSEVVCFGEIMLRLSPPSFQRFGQATSFDVQYGGGEANVAVSLAGFGMDSSFISKVPESPLGQAAINELRKYGVHTNHIARGGERLGIYFLERGASQRPSKVLYDRKNAAITSVQKGDFAWDEIFDGAKWFHFTGITPALSDSLASELIEALKIARSRNITVSCDLNYRKNLWSTSKARSVMGDLMPFVDLCIANEEDAEKVFQICAKKSDLIHGKLNHDGYREVAQKLVQTFGFKSVAITLRGSITASDNHWAAMYYDKQEFHFSRGYPIHIVDRVGGGDSFAAGLIYARMNGLKEQDAIEFAVAASCLKHTIEGDFNHVTLEEVQTLMAGDGSGRVQR